MRFMGASNGGGEWGVLAHHNSHHNRNNGPVNPSLKGIKYVIFPENKHAQRWDFVILWSIWYYAFYIPFHFGISGGYYTVYYDGFLVFNMIVNGTFLSKYTIYNCLFWYDGTIIFYLDPTSSLYIVDTFMRFFRAFRDKNGRIVYSLKAIRRSYIRSGWVLWAFFIARTIGT